MYSLSITANRILRSLAFLCPEKGTSTPRGCGRCLEGTRSYTLLDLGTPGRRQLEDWLERIAMEGESDEWREWATERLMKR